ncbi:MAG: hypothetical protein ACK5MW_01755 [Enterococcus sp.]
MKKTNFIVIFWLLLALIGFVVFAINFYGFFNDISFLLIPTDDKDYYMSTDDALRHLIVAIPMIIVGVTAFIVGIRQGLKYYHQLT